MANISARSRSLSTVPRLDPVTGSLQEECLRCVFIEHGAAAVVTTDKDGQILFLNPVAEGLLGLSQAAAKGRRAIGFLEEDGPSRRELLQVLAATGAVRGRKTAIHPEGGGSVPVELSVAVLGGQPDQAAGYMALFWDRSDEARLREELRANERRLAEIISTTADAVICMDEEGRILSWNDGAEEIYGYSGEEAVGRLAWDLLPGAGREEAAEVLGQRIRGEKPIRSWETVHARKDGSDLQVLVTLSPVRDSDGGLIGTSAVIKDVTHLKRLERELIRSERMAAVGELASSIAHEVKNPLAAIRGAVEILGDGFGRQGPLEVVQEVLGQIDRLDRLVKDLLSFARPDRPDKQPTKILDLMEAALEVLREEPLRKEISVYLNMDPELPSVPVDRRQMEQAFLNIILNAFQAMGGRGRLTVTTRREPGGVAVAFHDTGPGVPPADVKKILQPFYTTKHKGTGLGLSIVQKVVEAHDGRIGVENDPEGGAVFTLHLPCGRGAGKKRVRRERAG